MFSVTTPSYGDMFISSMFYIRKTLSTHATHATPYMTSTCGVLEDLHIFLRGWTWFYLQWRTRYIFRDLWSPKFFKKQWATENFPSPFPFLVVWNVFKPHYHCEWCLRKPMRTENGSSCMTFYKLNMDCDFGHRVKVLMRTHPSTTWHFIWWCMIDSCFESHPFFWCIGEKGNAKS